MRLLFRVFSSALIILIFSSCITLREEQFFFPENHGPLPPEAGVDAAQLELKSGNEVLSGVIVKNPSKDYLIMFYGNRNSMYKIRHRLYRLSLEYGLNVVCFDYRGYGRSTGRPTFNGLMDDADAIYAYVRKTYSPRMLFIFSQSIGTVPCSYLGSKEKLDGIIMEAPFTSAKEAVPRLNERAAFPPIKWFVRLSTDEKLMNREPQPVDYVRSFTAPLVILHGTDDEVFPQDIGIKLFDAAGSKNKVFVSLPGTGHSNVNLETGPAREALDSFFSGTRKAGK